MARNILEHAHRFSSLEPEVRLEIARRAASRTAVEDRLRRAMDEIRDSELQAAAEAAGFAWTMVEALATQIMEFQDQLEDDEEVGAALASFGRSTEIVIESVGHEPPHLIVITGWEVGTGKEVRLLQHVGQVNVFLKAMPARETPARRIGFATEDDDDDDGEDQE